MNDLIYSINKVVSATGTLGIATIKDETKIRVVVENAAGGNTVRVQGRIVGQSDWDTLLDIVGSSKQIVNVSTYDEIEVVVLAYASTGTSIKVISTSFNGADGSTNIDVPVGTTVTDIETVSFTSADSSVVITGDNLLNTIDFSVPGAAAVADLNTLSGVPSGNTDLGTFTGNIIPDNSDNKEALQSLEVAIEDHTTETVGAHAASAISNIPSGNLAAIEVQAALNELQTDVDTRATSAAQVAGDSAVQAFSIQRANHTGTQLASTISDFTTASQSASVADTIGDGVTTIAPSQNAVFDALATKQDTLGFTPENVANKATDLTSPDNIKYPTTLAVFNAIAAISSTGDIDETAFLAANNQVAPADVTGFLFSTGTVRSFKALVSVHIDATSDLSEAFELLGIQLSTGFVMSVMSTGQDSGVVFSITSGGQVQYTSTNVSGFVSDTIKFRSWVTTV